MFDELKLYSLWMCIWKRKENMDIMLPYVESREFLFTHVSMNRMILDPGSRVKQYLKAIYKKTNSSLI